MRLSDLFTLSGFSEYSQGDIPKIILTSEAMDFFARSTLQGELDAQGDITHSGQGLVGVAWRGVDEKDNEVLYRD